MNLHFAENIKYLRRQNGLTQKEFAEKIGAGRVTVCNWEQGTREPELKVIIKIADFFQVSLDALILAELKPPVPLYAKNVKYLRKKHEMTQDDMANLIGYRGKQGYNAIETGKLGLSVEKLEKISDYFGVTLDQLVKQDLSKGGTHDETP